MALPKKLKYLNLFNDGNSYLGLVSSLTLPKLTRKLENYRGGGMSGSVAVDFGLDELVLQQWGSVSDIPLRFAGSLQRDDTGDVSAVEVMMRGRHKEFDFGEYKQGEDTETKVTTQCTYFKLTIDGKQLIEIDTVNMVEIVNGVDRLAQHRTALGL